MKKNTSPNLDSGDKLKCNQVRLSLENKESIIYIYSGPTVDVLKMAEVSFLKHPSLVSVCNEYSLKNAKLVGYLLTDQNSKILDDFEVSWGKYTNGKKNESDFFMKLVRIENLGMLIFDISTEQSTIGTIHDKVFSNISAVLLTLTSHFGYVLEPDCVKPEKSISVYLRKSKGGMDLTTVEMNHAAMKFAKLYPEADVRHNRIFIGKEVIEFWFDKAVYISINNPTDKGRDFIEILKKELNAIVVTS